MHMIMFVLDDPHQLDAVLDAWEAIGVSGVTIVESTGIVHRRRARFVGASFMAGLNRMLESDQEGHYTLFTIVKGEQVVQACLRAAENVVGSLEDPHSGVLAAWPLTVVKGVPEQLRDQDQEAD
jgi:nitrogen regulatory protein P-II 1